MDTTSDDEPLANGDASRDDEPLADGEQIGETEQGIGNAFDIGIIPADTSCPDGSALSEIHMDNDDDGHGLRIGWVGAVDGTSDTTFRFCRVDGSNFHPLYEAAPSNVSAYYAVLKLGFQCPNGSHEFSRYFDNEDWGNGNWKRGDIEPSRVTSNTRMVFCLFKYATGDEATMQNFPELGIGYGVFADYNSAFPLAIDKGYVYTDDENRRNHNSYAAGDDWIYDAQRIISAGRNTYLGIARVR